MLAGYGSAVAGGHPVLEVPGGIRVARLVPDGSAPAGHWNGEGETTCVVVALPQEAIRVDGDKVTIQYVPAPLAVGLNPPVWDAKPGGGIRLVGRPSAYAGWWLVGRCRIRRTYYLNCAVHKGVHDAMESKRPGAGERESERPPRVQQTGIPHAGVAGGGVLNWILVDPAYGGSDGNRDRRRAERYALDCDCRR